VHPPCESVALLVLMLVFIGIEGAKVDEGAGVGVEEEDLRGDMGVQGVLILLFLLGGIDGVSVDCLVEGA
jgi:hypothetical protein